MTNPDLQSLIGATAVDSAGSKIGKIGQIYLDDATGQPQWVTISTGLFGNHESFAPLAGSRNDGSNLVLAVTKDKVKDAPHMADDGHLDDDENDRLYTYYAGQYGNDTSTYNTTNTANTTNVSSGTNQQVTQAAGTNTDDAMTLSEERLQVGTQNVVTGRAKLRKYIVTENVTTTVPVSHEEVHIEREPITNATATTGTKLSEEEQDVTLHAQQPVVTTETVPVERVRLATETVTENQQVTGQVRKEQVEETTDNGTTNTTTNTNKNKK